MSQIQILISLFTLAGVSLAGWNAYLHHVKTTHERNQSELWRQFNSHVKLQAEKWEHAAKEYWTRMDQESFKKDILSMEARIIASFQPMGERIGRVEDKLDRFIERHQGTNN